MPGGISYIGASERLVEESVDEITSQSIGDKGLSSLPVRTLTPSR